MDRRLGWTLLAAAMGIVWIGACTDVDIALARWMFDPHTRSFPWRHSWFAERFSHELLKMFFVACACCAIAAAAFDFWRPLAAISPWVRPRLRVVAASAVLVPLAVTLLKQMSASHCPWDLLMFGGGEEYVRLLEPLLAGRAAGRCMPAGHASTALWMVSLVVFWLPGRACTAALAGLLTLSLGLGVGWVQQMRGAHFLTHTLWSMWIACAIVGMLYARMPAALPCGQTPQSTS